MSTWLDLEALGKDSRRTEVDTNQSAMSTAAIHAGPCKSHSATLRVFVAIGLVAALVGCMGYVPGRQSYWDARVEEMCAKEGGDRILEVARLPRHQYELLLNRFGKLDIPLEQQSGSKSPIVRREARVVVRDGNPRVWKSETSIIRRSDQKVLGVRTTFTRSGGDLPSPAHESSFTCPDSSGNFFARVVIQDKEEQ